MLFVLIIGITPRDYFLVRVAEGVFTEQCAAACCVEDPTKTSVRELVQISRFTARKHNNRVEKAQVRCFRIVIFRGQTLNCCFQW